MKYLILLYFVLPFGFVEGQILYKDENGFVKFFSDAPLEDIEASTRKVKAIMNESTGEVAVLIPIQSFVFRNSLMREHFNENYMESDKYMEASFKGKLSEMPIIKPGENKDVKVSGELLIHGVQRPVVITVLLKKNEDGLIAASGKFNVKLEDHNIKIPSIVFQKIAEVVEVTFTLNLKPSR